MLSGVYAASADVYSFGITVSVLFGKHPFDLNTLELAYQVEAALRSDLKPILPSDMPKELAKLVLQCIAKNPNSRPDFVTIVQILKVIT